MRGGGRERGRERVVDEEAVCEEGAFKEEVDKSIEEVPDEENSDLHPGGAGQEAHTESIGRTKQDQDRKEGKNCCCVDYRDVLRGRCCGSHICTRGGVGSCHFKHDRNPIVVAGSKYISQSGGRCVRSVEIRGRMFFLHLKKKRLQLPSKKRSEGQLASYCRVVYKVWGEFE